MRKKLTLHSDDRQTIRRNKTSIAKPYNNAQRNIAGLATRNATIAIASPEPLSFIE